MAETINFIKSILNGLPVPQEGRTEYHDSKIKGLQLRVTAKGVKTFSVFKRIKGGDPHRETIGRYPDISIEQARVQAAKILSEIALGGNPASVRRAYKAELTFGELFDEYMTRHAKPRKKTADEDEQRYIQYLKKPFGNKKYSLVDRLSIAALHDEITSSGHPAVANRVLALVSTIFGRALEWGRVQTNPCIGIRRNPEKSRDRFLQEEELPRFFTALQAETNTTARDYLWVSLLTGARRANVQSMKWSDVNLSQGMWKIQNTKNDTPYSVPLPDEAVNIIRHRKSQVSKDSVYVFEGTGLKGHLVEPYKAWRRIIDNAGIQDIRIHDLRRTIGSWQAITGASLLVIGKSLNHKSTQTTAIYARMHLDPVKKSLQKATQALLAAGSKEVLDEFKPESFIG